MAQHLELPPSLMLITNGPLALNNRCCVEINHKHTYTQGNSCRNVCLAVYRYVTDLLIVTNTTRRWQQWTFVEGIFELVLLCRPFSKNVLSRYHHYFRYCRAVFLQLFDLTGCARNEIVDFSVLEAYYVQEVSMKGLSI
jgi:hypothetical protein